MLGLEASGYPAYAREQKGQQPSEEEKGRERGIYDISLPRVTTARTKVQRQDKASTIAVLFLSSV